MDQTYTQKEVDELLKRVDQIKMQKIDFNQKAFEGLAEFIRDFKIYTKTSKNIDLDKIEKQLRDINQEMQGLKVHVSGLQKQLKEMGVISGIKIFDERFDDEESEDWNAYNISAILPPTKNCGEITLCKNFEEELEDEIRSFKDDIYQIQLEIANFEKQLIDLKIQKQTLNVFKDTKKRSKLSEHMSQLKNYIKRDKQQLDRIHGGLEVLEDKKERILSIAPEYRNMIEQLIKENIYLHVNLERKQNELLTNSDSLNKTKYPYSILSFLKLFPNTQKHVKTLTNLSIYLEENNISNRDINGYACFPIEKFVDLSPCETEMMLLLNELNDDVFRKTLGLQPLPQKTEQYTKTDYLMDRDLSFGE